VKALKYFGDLPAGACLLPDLPSFVNSCHTLLPGALQRPPVDLICPNNPPTPLPKSQRATSPSIWTHLPQVSASSVENRQADPSHFELPIFTSNPARSEAAFVVERAQWQTPSFSLRWRPMPGELRSLTLPKLPLIPLTSIGWSTDDFEVLCNVPRDDPDYWDRRPRSPTELHDKQWREDANNAFLCLERSSSKITQS